MKRRKLNRSMYIGKGIHQRKPDSGILHSVMLRKLFLCIVVFGILFVFLFGSKRYASAQPKYRTNLSQIELSGGNIYWANDKAKEIVLNSIENSIRINIPDEKKLSSLIDADVVKTVYQAVNNSPWISEIWEVKKVYPNKIIARFEIRKPRIAVVVNDFIISLDTNGIILPIFFTSKMFQEFNSDLPDKLRIVVGLNAKIYEVQNGNLMIQTDDGKQLYCGDKWDDIRISSALTVNDSLDLIKRDRDFNMLRFDGISVDNFGGNKNLTASDIIINAEVLDRNKKATQSFISIWWGRDKEHAGYGENKVKDKIEMLRSIIKKHSKLTQISKIDLRFPNPELSTVYEYD